MTTGFPVRLPVWLLGATIIIFDFFSSITRPLDSTLHLCDLHDSQGVNEVECLRLLSPAQSGEISLKIDLKSN